MPLKWNGKEQRNELDTHGGAGMYSVLSGAALIKQQRVMPVFKEEKKVSSYLIFSAIGTKKVSIHQPELR